MIIKKGMLAGRAWLVALALWQMLAGACLAQGTAFTYQGTLRSEGVSANGLFDLSFRLYASDIGNTPVGVILINPAVALSNGLFTTTLDFGPAFNTGTPYWLEIGVHPTGTTNAFTILSPRQPITSAPYAITAANLTGTLSAGNLAGLSSIPLTLTNAGNVFAGNGGGLTNLNLSNAVGVLPSGSIPTNIFGTNLAVVPPLATAVHGQTPALGFNSWFPYGTAISEAAMLTMFQNAISNGMKAAGYKYFVIDQGWTQQYPDNWSNTVAYAAGQTVWSGGIAFTANVSNINSFPQQNPTRWRVADGSIARTNGVPIIGANFPHGIAWLANYAHTNGFYLGLYTCSTPFFNGFVGSGGYEWQDGVTYAHWGVDYVKIDAGRHCGELLIPAMMKNGQQVWYAATIDPSETVNDEFDPWVVGEANSHRGTLKGGLGPDMWPGNWPQLLQHAVYINKYNSFCGHGHWGDPDALACNAGTVFEKAQMGTFCALTTDILWDYVPEASNWKSLYYMTNLEAVAIDQDPGGYVGSIVASNASGMGWVMAKPLTGPGSGKVAVCLLNTDISSNQTITVNWSDIGLPPGPALVRDAFQQANLGYFTNSYTFTLAPKDCQLLTITAGTPPMFKVGTNYLSDLGYFFGWTNQSIAGYPLDGNNFLALPGRDISQSKTPITLAGKAYSKGLGVLASSHLQYALAGLASRFHSDVGIDQVFSGSSYPVANFIVSVDGVQVWQSGAMTPGQVATVDVSVAGGRVLTLDCVTLEPDGSSRDNSCDWAGACLTYDPALFALQNNDGSALTNVNPNAFTGTTLAADLYSVWKNGALQNVTVLPPGTTASLYPVLSINGLGPYFDASVSSLVAVTNATNVLAWHDLSGGGNDAVQANPAFQPSLVHWLSGNAVSFNSTLGNGSFTLTNFLTCKAPLNQSNFTMFALVVKNAFNNNYYPGVQEIWNLPLATNWVNPFANLMLRLDFNSSHVQPFVNQQPTFSVSSLTYGPQTNLFFLVCSNGGSTVLYDGPNLLNSGPTPKYVAPSTQPFYLGGFPPAGDLFNGSIAAFGYVNRPISTSEMAQIRTNIQMRFGLPVQ